MFVTFKIQQKYIDKGFKLRNELIIKLILKMLFFWSNRDDINESKWTNQSMWECKAILIF